MWGIPILFFNAGDLSVICSGGIIGLCLCDQTSFAKLSNDGLG